VPARPKALYSIGFILNVSTKARR